jgi:molybdopterin molybdotransferase
MDLVVVSGGSGRGDRDLVAGTLENLGAEIVIAGLAMRPGRHMVAARLGECLYLCLPGSPVACYALFNLFVVPALLSMMGCRKPFPAAAKARWVGPAVDGAVDTMIVLASMRQDLAVEPVEYHGSGDVLSIARADCLAAIPGGSSGIGHGEMVDVFRVGTP